MWTEGWWCVCGGQQTATLQQPLGRNVYQMTCNCMGVGVGCRAQATEIHLPCSTWAQLLVPLNFLFCTLEVGKSW